MHSLQKQQKIASWVHSTEPRVTVTPMLSLDGRDDALAVAHAASWRTDLGASSDLGTASPCMLTAPGLAATGFVPAEPFSLPCPSCAGLGAAGRKPVGHSKKRGRLPLRAPAVPRSWGNPATVEESQQPPDVRVDLQMLGEYQPPTTRKGAYHHNGSLSVIPSFLSYLLLPKQSANSKLSLNSDKKGMITDCSNILHVNQSTSHYVMQWHIRYKPFAECYPQLVGACSARVPWLFITC